MSGCVISDKPGNHNFELLKKLVLPDGSILRAQLPGRPTLDRLFVDPARDGTRFCDHHRHLHLLPFYPLNQCNKIHFHIFFVCSLLKIWNTNKFSGVVGVFNCQGAGWCKVTKTTRIHDAYPSTLTTSVQASDVDTIAQIAGQNWKGDTVVYAHRSRELVRLPEGASLPVTLQVLEYELFHFCPVKVVAEEISFAPIGLLDMFNSTGAVEQFEVEKTNGGSEPLTGKRLPVVTIKLEVRGCGRFGFYSSQKPIICTVDKIETEFNYEAATGLGTLTISVTDEKIYRCSVEIQV
ncbi:PREDICTED: probable galactinol--sucrose galactosyltransferase 2 [Erythranthe guttata]|uniref:probable galactinol--sucrose galactosyltransferase 2 n=1 Tax=Erythranthe guttata TaxID=4155 RepID=UPI00064E0154|nr:PREDICTED: probable galactinol--sucrose galactosyltransferase 2 [Erythranthe guttata]|eukprot:XP_012857188.1 PREDICTED: probable galactinol--sucrose galactosyltransferase 2 [Erythranthe guttata]